MSYPNEKKISMQYTGKSTMESHNEIDDQSIISDNKNLYDPPNNIENERFIPAYDRTKRNFGTHLPFFFIGRDPFFTIGPDWQYFLCMWLSLLAIGILVNFYVAAHLPIEVRILTQVVTLFQSAAYILTSLRNPGIASRDPMDKDEEGSVYPTNPAYCQKCRVMRSNTVYHCVDCDVCIKEFDHHCPWTGKCIGQGNVRLFYLFLGSTMVYIVYCIIITCVVTASISSNFKPQPK